MLQFLPMIMSLLDGQKKEKQAQSQNSAAAMLGQAPTASAGGEGGGLGGAISSGLSMLQGTKGPGQDAVDTIEGAGPSTDSMLDDAIGPGKAKKRQMANMGMPQMWQNDDVSDEDLLNM